jgi:hypothetical protein
MQISHLLLTRKTATSPYRIVTASWDKLLKVWDLDSVKLLHTLRGECAQGACFLFLKSISSLAHTIPVQATPRRSLTLLWRRLAALSSLVVAT